MSRLDSATFQYASPVETRLSRLGNWAMRATGAYHEDAREVEPDHDAVVFPAGYLEGRVILVAEREGGHLFSEVLATARQASALQHCLDFSEVSIRARPDIDNRFIALVDMDSFDSIGEGIERLRRFRTARPHTVVVIASRHFMRNDFSRDRRCIADASITLPCHRAQLAMAIAISIENNTADCKAKFRSRRRRAN